MAERAGEPRPNGDILADVLSQVLPATEADLRAEVERLRAGLSHAALDVLAERQRQISAEGWTPAHDDAYQARDLAMAVSCYAMAAGKSYLTRKIMTGHAPRGWPFAESWWKPTTPRRDLVESGALILAEIERLDRALSPETDGGQG